MKRNKLLLYFLSLLPGLGHLYLGLMTRGLQFMLLFFGAIFVIANSFGSLALILPVIFFYSYFDALQMHRMHQEMAELYDEPLVESDWLRRNKHLFGWVLIGFGALMLLKQMQGLLTQFLPQFLPAFISYELLQNLIMSIVLVLVGLQILRRKPVEDEWDTLKK